MASVSVQVEPKSEKNKENKCKPVPGRVKTGFIFLAPNLSEKAR